MPATMSSEPRGSSGSAPAAAPVPASPTPPAAPAVPASGSLPNKDFASQVAAIRDPRAMRELLASVNRPAAPGTTPAPASPEPAAGTPPAAAPAAEPAPATEPAPEPAPEPTAGEPPAEPDPAAEPAPEPAPEPEPTPEPDDPDPNPEGEVTPVKKDRARLRLTSEVDKLAAAYKIRNKDWSLEQALDAAKTKLGVKPATPAAPEPTAPVANPDLPQTVAAVDSAIEQLEAEMVQAGKDLDPGKQAELQVKIRRLDRHRANLEGQETLRVAERQAARETEYNTQFDASQARAVEFYPDAAKPESDFSKRMVEIEQTLKASNNELYFSPDKPLKIAQMVANERSIAPRKPGSKAPAPATKPAAPKPPAAAPKGILPTGGSKTAPAPTVNPVDDQIRAARTPNDLYKLMRTLGRKDF